MTSQHSDGQDIMAQLSDYVFELLEKLEIAGYSESIVLGEQALITTLERDEDILVYLCSVAERLAFNKKIGERSGNTCEPRLKSV